LGLIIMAQFHHVVFYDTAREAWFVDPQTDAYFPDGEVYDYAGSQEWEGVPEAEEDAYNMDIAYLQYILNSGDQGSTRNSHK
jgi:hypothetical protein